MQGARLGTYEVIDLLGRGGMGEVWRARDTSLGREVAIKVLPTGMAEDPERALRFEREAKLLATLNHPSIAQIYGYETSGDVRFLAMELAPGGTLARRLEAGPVPVDEALHIALRIAEALEAAHGKGVIHRDLKPGNVMVDGEDVVKVLDFGIARAMQERDAEEGNVFDSPTITADYTRPGTLLGTAAYMSPEQARGRPVDKRSDIWSFGAVLYEMLTGEPLFSGETATDILGAIMHRDPDWSRLPANTPPTVQLLLRRCLTRDRRRRLHDIADARVELEAAIADPGATTLSLAGVAVEAADRRGRRRPRVLPLALAFVIGAALVGAAAWMLRPMPEIEPQPVRRFVLEEHLKPRRPAISPDGSKIAFTSDGDLYVRRLDALEAERIVDAEESREHPYELVWSPDSAAICYLNQDGLWRVSISGGDPILITEKPTIWGLDWTDDGRITMADQASGAILAIGVRGGPSTPLVNRVDGKEIHLHGGGALPDGAGVMFVPHTLDGAFTTIMAVDAAGERRVLYEAPENVLLPQYVEPGYIVYALEDGARGVWALPFSLMDMRATGEPALVTPGAVEFSVSERGDFVFARNAAHGEVIQLTWFALDGTMQGTVGPELKQGTGMSISPDGRYVAISAIGLGVGGDAKDTDIWLIDVDRGIATRLADEAGHQMGPSWSPDGTRVAYTTLKTDDMGLSTDVRAVDGSGAPKRLLDGGMGSFTEDWSAVAYCEGDLFEGVRIMSMNMNDPESARVFQDGSDWDLRPQIRPGGALIAYLQGDFIGADAVLYLRRWPDGAGRWRVTQDAVVDYKWDPSGEALYYNTPEAGDMALMRVKLEIDGDEVRISDPERLFAYRSQSAFGSFEIAPEGDRVLIAVDATAVKDEEPEEGIVLIQNWPATLDAASSR